MKTNYYNVIFVAIDVAVFTFINFSLIHANITLGIISRLLFLTFIIFPVGNVILIYQELFKRKIYILLFTYLLSYIAKVLILAAFSNERTNILSNMIYLHTEKGAFIRLMLPFLISFALTIILFMILNIKRTTARVTSKELS